MVRQRSGPTRPGTNVSRFRSTGVSRPRGPSGSVVGPTRPGTDVEIFRATGKSVASGSAEAARLRVKLQAQAQQKAQAKAQAELSAKQKAEAKRQQIAKITQLNKAREIRIRRQQKEFGKILASKTIVQKKKFLIEQKQLSRAIDIQRIQDSGRKITSKQQRILNDAKQKIIKKQEESQSKSQAESEARLNKLIRKEINKNKDKKVPDRKLTIIEQINLFGAGTTRRKRNYLADLKLTDLDKEESRINKDINKINSKFTGDLTQSQFAQYQREIAPVFARYNTYTLAKRDVLIKFPDKEISAVVKFDPVVNRNVLVLDKQDQNLSAKVNRAFEKGIVRIERGKDIGKTTALLSGLVIAKTGIDTIKGFAAIPSVINAIRKDPSLIKKIPSAIKRAGKDFGGLLRVSPTTALVKIGASFYAIKITNAGFRQLGRLSSAGFVRLNPKFSGALTAGKSLDIKTGGGKIVRLEVVNKIPTKTIKAQIKLAGKTQKIAVSTQADRLIGILKGSKVLKKPLGKTQQGRLIEDVLGRKSSALLKRFDAGKKLSNKQINFLDNSIKKAGSKGLLERSFFADPSGKIRPSRTGINKDTKLTLLDYLTEDFSFKKSKPQILLFEKAVVEKFPPKIRKIANKLEKGKKLTSLENARYLQFTSKPSGKFKALGFASREAELTLPAGQIIKKVKKVGVTRFKGINIPILKVKIVKPTKNVKNLIKKLKSGTITNKEIKKLNKALKRNTGLDYGLTSSRVSKGSFINTKRIISSVTSRGLKRRRVSKPSISRPVSRKRFSKTSSGKSVKFTKSGGSFIITKSGPKFIKSPKRPSPPSPRPLASPPSRIRSRPPVPKLLPRKRKKSKKVTRKRKTKKQGFNVFARPTKKRKGQKRPKLVKVNKVPLSKKRAEDLRNFIADTSLARTARIKPTILKAKRPQTRVPAGFASRTKSKFRTFRIVKGIRVPLRKGKVIEKRTKLLDTRSEKRGITLRRRIKQITPKKRKMTKTQRDIMLKNLKKARKKRLNNLKGRNKK